MYNKQEGLRHKIQRLYIHWDITTMCPYKCSYCYAVKEYGDDWMRPGNYSNQLEVIDEMSKSTLPIFLGLLGGEPTYHYKYFEMLDLIEEKILSNHEDNRLYITTNGAKDNKFFEKHKEMEGYSKIGFLWSFHPEYMDEEVIDTFIKNIEITQRKGYRGRVNVMLHPAKKYWELTKKFFKRLSEIEVKTELNIHPHFIYSDPHSYVKYSDTFYEEFAFIKDYEQPEYLFYKGEDSEDSIDYFSDSEVFNKRINTFKGWNCWNNNYEINLNCNMNQFCFEGKKAIPKDFFKNLTEIKPVRCPHDFCSCDGLLKIKKEK